MTRIQRAPTWWPFDPAVVDAVEQQRHLRCLDGHRPLAELNETAAFPETRVLHLGQPNPAVQARHRYTGGLTRGGGVRHVPTHPDQGMVQEIAQPPPFLGMIEAAGIFRIEFFNVRLNLVGIGIIKREVAGFIF